MNYVSYDEFKKMDIRLGTIRAVEPVEGTDKLLKFQIQFGFLAPEVIPPTEEEAESAPVETLATETEPKPDIRQIVSGIREYYPDFETLIGKQVLYIVNLEPRTIKGVESNGMLMAVDGLDGKPVFLIPEVPVASGAQVR